MTASIVRRNFIFPLFSLGALMAAWACTLPGEPAPAEPAPMAEGAAEPGLDRIRINSPLAGRDWIIASIGGVAVTGKPPVIRFGEDGRVSGYGGCNQFNGGYTLDGETVTFTPIMMTMMACAAANRNQMENALGAALQGDATFVVDGDGMLTLTGANGTEITAMRAPALKLAGTAWRVEGIGGVAVVSGSEPEITFTDDGKINGTTGCNRFFGGYAQDSGAVTFTGTGMTKMACLGDGLMAQESAFAGILSGAATASVDGLGRLTIMGADGVGFVAAPALSAKAALDPAVLLGAEWVVQDINRGGVTDNSRLTLMFGEDGRVSGSTNCNRLSGLYAADGGTITFTPLATTRRACLGEGLMMQERKYMSALGGEMAWTITADGALELTGDEGRRVLLRR
ncbi:META domain-containing protein [Hyphomonas sp.]|uniref:META domain-containing protein n=1 Tax=Hyphomonas sp. TaxID=87 RepID=UPI0025C4B678|nr:META domain-containing protein [Hyphomonas sp.]